MMINSLPTMDTHMETKNETAQVPALCHRLAPEKHPEQEDQCRALTEL
jgi:hypothetical protein